MIKTVDSQPKVVIQGKVFGVEFIRTTTYNGQSVKGKLVTYFPTLLQAETLASTLK